MEKITVPFITGDGVGAEVTPSMQAVVDAALKKAYGDSRSIGWKEVLAGERAFNETGSWLPEETMEAFRTYKVGIKGPLTTPVGGGIRSLNVALRQTLDLYVCLRPVRWYRGVVSPVKEPQKVNMCVFRENTEDIYAGIEWEAGTPEAEKFYRFLHDEMGVTKVRFPETSSFGVKPVSKEGTERLVRAACRYALENGLSSVTLVHKGNIMKFTEGGFKKWGYELAEREFGKDIAEGRLVVKDCIADAFLQNTLLVPEEYSVIATLNLNGDYISDQLAAMVGGIGIAPGANINYRTGQPFLRPLMARLQYCRKRHCESVFHDSFGGDDARTSGLERGRLTDRGSTGEQFHRRSCYSRFGPLHAGWCPVVYIGFYTGNREQDRSFRK